MLRTIMCPRRGGGIIKTRKQTTGRHARNEPIRRAGWTLRGIGSIILISILYTLYSGLFFLFIDAAQPNLAFLLLFIDCC